LVRARRIVIRTTVAVDVEASVARHLLQIALAKRTTCNSSALARAILETPQFQRAFRAKAGARQSSLTRSGHYGFAGVGDQLVPTLHGDIRFKRWSAWQRRPQQK